MLLKGIAQDKDIAAGDLGIVGKAQDVDPAARGHAGGGGGVGPQRANDHVGAVANGGLGQSGWRHWAGVTRRC